MVNVDIRCDIQEVHSALKELGINLKNINRKILKRVTIKARSKARKAFTLNSKTGELKKSIYSSSRRNDVGFVGMMSKKLYRFIPHEYGATLVPKKEKYLKFQINGEWKSVKSVHIPARPFLVGAIQGYVESNEFNDDIQIVLDREVNKAMEKGL